MQLIRGVVSYFPPCGKAASHRVVKNHKLTGLEIEEDFFLGNREFFKLEKESLQADYDERGQRNMKDEGRNLERKQKFGKVHSIVFAVNSSEGGAEGGLHAESDEYKPVRAVQF